MEEGTKALLLVSFHPARDKLATNTNPPSNITKRDIIEESKTHPPHPPSELLGKPGGEECVDSLVKVRWAEVGVLPSIPEPGYVPECFRLSAKATRRTIKPLMFYLRMKFAKGVLPDDFRRGNPAYVTKYA